MPSWARKVMRCSIVSLCAVLSLGLLMLAAAVLALALAALLIAALAAAALLPHPPAWYLREGADCLRDLLSEYFPAFREGKGKPFPQNNGTQPDTCV